MRFKQFTGGGLIVLLFVGVLFYVFYSNSNNSYTPETSTTTKASTSSQIAQKPLEYKTSVGPAYTSHELTSISGPAIQRGIQRASMNGLHDRLKTLSQCHLLDQWMDKDLLPFSNSKSWFESLPTILQTYLNETAGIMTGLEEQLSVDALAVTHEDFVRWNQQLDYTSDFTALVVAVDKAIATEQSTLIGYNLNLPTHIGTQAPEPACKSIFSENLHLFHVKPEEGLSYISVGPSFSAGALAGMNEAGVQVALVSNENLDTQSSVSPLFVITMLLQYAHSKSDAYYCLFNPVEFFQNRYQYTIEHPERFIISGKFMVVDKTGIGSVYTVSNATKLAQDFPNPGGYQVISQMQFNIQEENIDEKDDRIAYVKKKLHELTGVERMTLSISGVGYCMALVAQEKDAYANQLSVLFHPSQMDMYVSYGKVPAATERYRPIHGNNFFVAPSN